MYNPFPLLNERLLQDKIKEGKRYFVRQTFRRGMEPRLKAAFLFRAYEEEEKEIAQSHMEKIAKDPHAFMYDATMQEHLVKLHIAAKQPFGFKIYYAGKKGMDWKPPVAYQIKMRKYIQEKHPTWGTIKDGPQVEVGLMEKFGELLLKLSYENEEELIPITYIENY
jgi:hypothetical protein